MTPDEFKQEVQEIIDKLSHDPEMCHYEYDDLCEHVLRELGYGEGIDLVENITFWYA